MASNDNEALDRFNERQRGGDVSVHETRLGSIESSISHLRERLAQSTGELGSIADRVLGPVPEQVRNKGTGLEPRSGSALAAIIGEIEFLASEIEAIEERVKRLGVL